MSLDIFLDDQELVSRIKELKKERKNESPCFSTSLCSLRSFAANSSVIPSLSKDMYH